MNAERGSGELNSETAASGLVVRVRGSVVDVGFSDGVLPALNEALIIEWKRARPLLVEVEEHLDPHTVRAVSMQNTAGLSRGCAVRKTGGQISVPVGEKMLGRLVNAVGEPIDALGAFAIRRPTMADSSSRPGLQPSGPDARSLSNRN